MGPRLRGLHGGHSSCPEFIEAYVARAEILLRQRDFDEALADCNSAVRVSPQWVRGHYCRALAYRGKGDTRRAISAIRQAIELSPDLRVSPYVGGLLKP